MLLLNICPGKLKTHSNLGTHIQLLSKIFIDSDFCHNYLHTLYLFACLLKTYALFDVGFFSATKRTIYLVIVSNNIDCSWRFFVSRITF